ncbi:unnamed protein product [Closterium sp. NIES-53]
MLPTVHHDYGTVTFDSCHVLLRCWVVLKLGDHLHNMAKDCHTNVQTNQSSVDETAQAAYAAVVARYSSPATAALGRLLLTYLFPELSAFATVEDLVSHLRTSDSRYRTTIPTEFLDRNQPSMFITLYVIVTRLPDSLRSVRDHFLSLDPTSLTVDLLEQHLLAGETSAVAVGAARGTPRPPFFEGCSPFPLAPSYASAAAADVCVAEDVGAASASAKRRSSKGKGGRGGGGGSGGGGGGSKSGCGGSSEGSEGSGGGGGGGTGGGSGGSGGGGGGSGGSGGSGGRRTIPRHGGLGGGKQQQQQRRSETQSPQQLREWLFQRGTSGGSDSCLYVILTGVRAGQTCQKLHTQHRYFLGLDDAWIAIFDLDLDAILSAIYALSVSAEGDCYRCVPPNPGIVAATLGASEFGTLPGTAPAEALHTFTLDSGASRCFFRENTTLTPLPAPVPVRLADPSGGPVVAHSSTVLACPVVPSGSLSGLHLPSFSIDLTLLWHHRLGHPSLPRLLACTLVFLSMVFPGLCLSPSLALPCLPCVEGRQRAAPHSSSFPSTIAPLQTLHMDVWGPVDRAASATFCCLHLHEHFDTDLPVVRLHSDRGAKWDAERRIGLVMEVARTSMIHATAPHFLWPFAICFTTPSRVVSSRLRTSRSRSRFPYCSAPLLPLRLFLAPGPPPVDPLLPQGPAPSRLSQVDPLPGTALVEAAVSSGAAQGAASGSAASGGAEPRGEEPGGAEPEGVEPGGAESEGAEFRGAEPRAGTGGAGAGGAGVGGIGAGGIGVAGARAVDPGAGGAGGTVRPRLYFVPLLQQVLDVPSSTSLTPPLLCPPPDQSQPPLLSASPLPAPSPYTEQSGGLTKHREPASRPVSSVRTSHRVPRSRPPPVPSTHAMALRPSSVPLRVPLSAPPESSLPQVPNPASDRARADNPTVSRLLASAVTDPFFESAAASALVAELLDFAAACRLDYATALVAKSTSATPPSVGGECDLGTDVLEDRQEDFECLAAAVPRFASMLLAPEGDPDAPDISTARSYAEAITDPYSSHWEAAIDAEMASWKSTGTYAHYIARGFSQRQGVDYFQNFSPTSKMTTLRVLLHVAAQRDYELHSLDFSTAFLQGSLHEEIWLRHPVGSTGSFPAGTQWSLPRPVYGLRQAPRELQDTLRTTLAALGFAPATAEPSLFLRIDTSLLPFYVLLFVDDLVFATAHTEALTLVKSELQKRPTCTDLGPSALRLPVLLATAHSSVYQPLVSAPPSDESVEPSGPYPELVGCLMYLMTCTRPDLAYPLSLLARYVALGRHRKVYYDAAKRVLRYLYSTSGMGLVLGGRGPVVLTGHADASWVDDSATQRLSQGYTFSVGSGSKSWRSTRSSSVLSSSCEAEIYAGAMAAQELRWLTYLLTNLGEQPRSPPILYVDNKAMIALCQEHRLEHRTKHIALRYFLAQELQQRGQLCLAYVATRANTADIFTKALPPGDHQRFSTVLGLVPTLPHLLTA